MVDFRRFTDSGPKRESAWRGIVLLGLNDQSYKFALAKSLLDLANDGRSVADLEELAIPYSHHSIEHLKRGLKQGTQPSPFLDACRSHIAGQLSLESLITSTVNLGFRYVLDRFHTVGSNPVQVNFFTVSGERSKRRITLSDELFTLASGSQQANIYEEIEARWRLVEHAWEMGVEKQTLTRHMHFDPAVGELVTQSHGKRISLAGARAAIGGYQKGTCFYCGQQFDSAGALLVGADVDHFIPWSLGHTLYRGAYNLNGIWNLVVACADCNRGTGGKFAQLPSIQMLHHLHERNEYFIMSHHPLHQALKEQTGVSERARAKFLNGVWQEARDHGVSIWEPTQRGEAAF